MQYDKHRNWLLTILQIRLPFILWGSFVLILIVGALTFVFRPIYSARTILTLDADLTKVLRNVDTAYPSTAATDLIRYEYFATHAVNLMRIPQLAERLVGKWNLRDRWGDRLFPEYFIEPSIFQLLFSNNGQGIRIEWISDTQQFSISGYSKEPDRAIAFSRDYAKAFLEENSEQFKDILLKLAERFDLQRASVISRIDVIDAKIREIHRQNRTANLDSEVDGLTERILDAKTNLDESRFSEKTYQRRVQFFRHEVKKHEKLKEYEHIMEANPQIQFLKQEIVELTGSLLRASVDYTPENPEYKAIEKDFNNAKESLKKEAKRTFYHGTMRRPAVFDTVLDSMLDISLDHLAYETEVRHYESIIEQCNERLEELVAVHVITSNLGDEKETLSGMLSRGYENRQAIEDILNRPLPFFRVVSFARINKENLKYYKYFPRKKLIVALTLIASFLTLSFLIVAKELYANTLYQGWQLSALKRRIDYVNVPDLNNLTKNRSGLESIVCKYIHEICLATKDSQIIRITSGTEGEGKTTIARALAWYCQKTGKSVVLVDGDIAHQSLSITLGLDKRHGLIEYLYTQKEIADIIVKGQITGISIIPAGSRHVIDPDMPVITRLETLFSILTSDYEKIIFLDLPSSENDLMLSDNLPSHDVIMVLRSGKHSIYEVTHMAKIQEMTEGQAIPKGVIINKMPFMADLLTLKGLIRCFDYLIREPFRRLHRGSQ